MRRGDLWWADLEEPRGRRPVLLIMRDDAYARRSEIIVTPITTRIRNLPTEVRLGPQDGLRRASVANLDVIITISKYRFEERIGSISLSKLRAVDAALRYALALE